MATDTITMYGTQGCSDCLRSRAYLDQANIPYTYINIELDISAAKKVETLNQGLRRVPTIVFSDQSILVEPTNTQLENHLYQLGLLA